MDKQRGIPVIIGVADIVNRSVSISDAKEPMRLMLEAIHSALSDALENSDQLCKSIDSVDVVRTWSWPYPDLPSLLSSELGIDPRHKFTSEHGGNSPAKLVDEAARRISLGQSKVAVVTGGEALASLSASAKEKKLPPPGWTKLDQAVDSVFSPTTRPLADSTGAIHSIGAPIHVYPLYENGFRAHRKQTIAENNAESARLYADFAKVAESNRFAWNYGKAAETEQSIGTVTRRNRMICFPYPLLMNAHNTVNLAAAVILTSTEFAQQLGVPKSKWIYPLGGAGTRDSYNFWEHPNFHSSRAISRSLDSSMQISGLQKEDIDFFDFYSCFPIVPKIACDHLGFSSNSPPKPITLLGGLTSFGGAGNNYSMHAITEGVRQLRKGRGRNGVVLANGGVMTYQHVIVLSTQSRKDKSAYPDENPLPDVLTDGSEPAVDAQAEGPAVIETYTVEFDRNGKPFRGHVVGRLKSNGHRFLANHGDISTLQQLASSKQEPIGRTGSVKIDQKKKGRNIFVFGSDAKL